MLAINHVAVIAIGHQPTWQQIRSMCSRPLVPQARRTFRRIRSEGFIEPETDPVQFL